MNAEERWIKLGWHHPLWNIIRLYTALKGKNKINKWEADLKKQNIISLNDSHALDIEPKNVNLFFEYMEERERLVNLALKNLRTEDESFNFCQQKGLTVKKTKTQNKTHHQSSKSMVAAVSAIAEDVCKSKRIKVNSNPQDRCAWNYKKKLHVTARNLDGAIPSLMNPSIIWEIKEYWGKTKGGSKMSDALYECNLVGLELREYEERTKRQVMHIVFLDGKEQWQVRKADLKRFIDIMNQGLIDCLIVGREVESEWRRILEQTL